MITLLWIDDEERVRQIEVDAFTVPDVCEAVGVSYEDLVTDEESVDSDEDLDSYSVENDTGYTTIIFQFVSTPSWFVVGLTCDWENDN